VRLLLTKGRRDDSGDFTKGAGLSDAQAELIIAFTAAGRPTRAATCAALRDLVQGSNAGLAGIAELEEIGAVLSALGVSEETIPYDPSIVRGLAYYTGPVLEAQITFAIEDEQGRPMQFGSVASGGRYDGLVGRFLDREIPATGVSIGVDRLLAALDAAGRAEAALRKGPVLIVVFDKPRMTDYARMAQELRAAGIAAELFLGEGGMKAQLRYADRRGSPVAVIAGEDEFKAGTVSVKDLILGAQLADKTQSNEEWRAAAKARAQVTVPRGDLAATVAAMLSRS
jgi:histidyl-tRNA synthetase